MQELSQLVQSLVIIVMLAVFLELLLPSSGMRSYVQMVMGLLVVIAVLQLVFKFINTDFKLQVPELSATPVSSLAEIQTNAQKITEHYKDRAMEDYKAGIAKQVMALAKLNQHLHILDVQVELHTEEGEQYGRLASIQVTVTDPQDSQINGVEKVEISVDANQEHRPVAGEQLTSEQKKAVDRITDTVADFYNLPKEHVRVVYTK